MTRRTQPNRIRIEFDLVGESAAAFAETLNYLNEGLTPAHPDWWTPSQLAASLVSEYLVPKDAPEPSQEPGLGQGVGQGGGAPTLH